MKTNLSIKSIMRKSYQAFRSSLFQILCFVVACKALATILIVPLLRGILNLALRVRGQGFVTNGAILSFFFSPVGLLASVLLFVLSVLFIYTEFSVLVTLIYYGTRNERVKTTQVIRHALAEARGLVSVHTVRFGVYVLVILPLADMGIVSSLLPSLSIPNFIIGTLSQTLWGALLLLAFALFILFAGTMLSYSLPAMVLERIPFRSAATRSRAAMKKTLFKRFVMELLFLLVWVLLLMIPLIVLGYIIDVRGFLAPNMLDVFTTYGIAWRAFVCLLAVAGIWVLQVLFMPMMLSIVTVTYLELDDSNVTLADSLPSAAAKGSGKRWRRVVVAALTVCVVVFASNVINTISDFLIWPARQEVPVVMGHRGSLGGVENTLEAIQGAIDAGVEYAEIDVQLSADGVPVVVHDTNLSRLSGQRIAVYNRTAAELASIELTQNGRTGSIPTLEEVIQYCRGRIMLNIELKLHGYENGNLVDEVLAVVEQEEFGERCVYQSLSYELVQRMREARPAYRTGYIVYGNLGSPNTLGLRQMDIDFLVVEEGFASKALLIACRKADIPLYVWTVNDQDEMRRFWELGVDGLITDHPDLARQALEQVASS